MTGARPVASLRLVKRWAKLAVAMLLGVSLGMQWTVLQSLAWTTMILSRTGEEGFVAAVRSTFDGHHPCTLCHVVKKGKDAQKKQDAEFAPKKFDATLAAPAPTPLLTETARPAVFVFHDSSEQRSEPPSLPPPRNA